MPNLCELPTAISAPNSAGVFNFARASKSQTKTALPFFLCILLIASALSDGQLMQYKEIAESIGLDVLVEIHNQEELKRILPINFSLIGINNRNLSTFEVNLNTTKELSINLKDKLIVSESGIQTKEDVSQILSYGVLNFLVGESFMRANDPGEALERLFFL